MCCATQSMATICASLLAGHIADRWISAERFLGVCSLLAGVDLWLLADLHERGAVFVATLVFWLLTGPIWLLGSTICFAHLRHPERQYGPVRLWGTVGWMAAAWLIVGWLVLSNADVVVGVAAAFSAGSLRRDDVRDMLSTGQSVVLRAEYLLAESAAHAAAIGQRWQTGTAGRAATAARSRLLRLSRLLLRRMRHLSLRHTGHATVAGEAGRNGRRAAGHADAGSSH